MNAEPVEEGTFDKLRAPLGRAQGTLAEVDALEARARELIVELAASGWSTDAVPEIVERSLGAQDEVSLPRSALPARRSYRGWPGPVMRSRRSCTRWMAGMSRLGHQGPRYAD